MINRCKTLPSKGFTLLELMITVAIIAIIAAVAIPAYIDYTKKTYYSELVRATAPFKLGVIQCFNTTGTFNGCSSGATPYNGIPPSITAPPSATSAIKTITVVDGKIIAVPNSAVGGLKEDQVYMLEPTSTNGMVTWAVSGKGVTDGLTR
jgi:type IV pilus assembly protein PilA